MAKFFGGSLIVFCVMFLSQMDVLAEGKFDPSTDNLVICKDDALGVKFLCDPNWKMRSEDGAVFIILSSDPDVTLIIAKLPSPFHYLEQLSDETLAGMQHYADGFKVEKVSISGRLALKVKAFSKIIPENRLLDYYLVQDDAVYSLLFSVNPKEKIDDYKFTFQAVAESFSLVKVSK